MARSKGLFFYRWCVFLLAAFYAVWMVTTSDYSGAGGPFRYLTIWALLCSFFCASRLIALMEGRSDRRWDGFIAMTAVINAMVVFLYWKLFFEDPSSVTRDGALGVWWKEYYLHALGPLLQWIDALFLHRAFRRLKPAMFWLLGLVSVYLAWGELFVAPMNDSPIGSVTSGLPYPFLNDLVLADRLAFYGVNLGIALVLLCVFTLFGRLIMRIFPQPKER
ncbi:androgen-induced gene 1 family protein [Nereida sp. MMG025]|uniref:androgen-induced gene 1 family protein n=1 Tax=Nereida sp. MMG025 TaxID=2909981 RepID=UPI001F2B5812|nr:androgen-induced gene 1 family protein [Nereida sp. MMG025]MCF6444522.1 androgen-induced gene 1 family protein [Nereida sp. MMG025]